MQYSANQKRALAYLRVCEDPKIAACLLPRAMTSQESASTAEVRNLGLKAGDYMGSGGGGDGGMKASLRHQRAPHHRLL